MFSETTRREKIILISFFGLDGKSFLIEILSKWSWSKFFIVLNFYCIMFRLPVGLQRREERC